VIFLGSFANNGEDVSAFHESPIIMEDSPSASSSHSSEGLFDGMDVSGGRRSAVRKVPFLLRKTNRTSCLTGVPSSLYSVGRGLM